MNLRAACLLLLALSPASLPAADPAPPALMLATVYSGGLEVSNYWISEKLDGVRGYWDGSALRTRGGRWVVAPGWFTAGWPRTAMDGELWMGRGRFERVSGLVRAGEPADPAWHEVRFMVFDLPDDRGRFEERVLRMRRLLGALDIAWLRPVEQFRLTSAAELAARLETVVAAGGEGLMLHRRDAVHHVGRSDALLKYKPADDAEARVIGYTAGRGKYAGLLGALIVHAADGRRFRLGSGFSDLERAHPPPIGSWVTYRYNGLTSKGLPRFARFLRIRHQLPPPDPAP